MRKEDQWNKGGEHCIDGPASSKISSFKLASTDQDKERRNFQGYQTHSPGQALMDEISCEGSTETRGGKGMNSSYKGYAGELKRRFK